MREEGALLPNGGREAELQRADEAGDTFVLKVGNQLDSSKNEFDRGCDKEQRGEVVLERCDFAIQPLHFAAEVGKSFRSC